MATMSPKDFRRWRKAMDLSQKDAAEALGLKRRVVQYYEKGERDGESVDIPKYVRLACYALMQGVKDYKGPPKDEADESVADAESDVVEPAKAEAATGPAPVKEKPGKAPGKGRVRKTAGKAATPAPAGNVEDSV